ncbi:MAG: ArsA family ATPase [Myxococcota bacterium]
MSLVDVLDTHRVVVCVGSGGVGKTTTAAALAVHAACGGQRVLCLTIDPARRLANSLGLSEMTTEEQEVAPEVFAEYGLECTGRLSAMMLDTKRTFDDLVTRNASSPEARDRILSNRLYQYISTSLAGTQEYMAMEKLHSVHHDRRFDLVVLDTPPTANALDFLDAPERLINAIDSPAMRWFVQAFQGAGKLSLGLVGKGAAYLIRGLAKFTGIGFLEQVAEFVTGINELFGGFRDRANAVAADLRGEDVAFVIVTSPSPLNVEEAVFFDQRLREAGMAIDAFVLNNVHPLLPEPNATDEALRAELAQALGEDVDVDRAFGRMQQALDDERVLAVADRIEAERLQAQAGDASRFVQVPAFEEDVHDLTALARVARYLTGTSTMEPTG